MTALIDLYKAESHQALVEFLVREYGIANSAPTASSVHEALASIATPNNGSNPHRNRREEMAQRIRLYRDDYAKDMGDVIDMIWRRPDYRDKMKSYLGINTQGSPVGGVATQQNASVRIVNEVASLYDKPAVRRVSKSLSKQQAFKDDEKRLRLHEITQDYHRLLWLCNEVLVWLFKGVDGKTKLRVVTPDIFDAIPHPGDKTVMAGILMQWPRVSMMPQQQAAAKLPVFELWDDTYRYLLNSGGKMIDEAGNAVQEPERHEHPGKLPGVLLHRREPSEKCLDPRPGRDIASAHRGVCLINIKMLQLSKEQGEQQPVLQGNLANVAKDQTGDGENPYVLPPEVTMSLLNTVTSPDHLLKVKAEILRSVGQTYGVSFEEETAATADSAKVYQARREKLSELRTEQHRRAVVNEAEVIELIGYDSSELKVDHREQALPQNPIDMMALLDIRVRLGMDSPLKAIMREDPDLSPDDALELARENIAEWATIIQVVRALNIPGTATATDPGQTPEINGSGKIVEKMNPDTLVGNGQPPAPPSAMPQKQLPPGK